MDFSSIGKNIRKYRKQRGLTLEALAEKVGLSTNYIGALERGEKALALKTLINIVDALDITADMILCDVTKNGYKVKSSVLTEKLESISPSEREKILQMVVNGQPASFGIYRTFRDGDTLELYLEEKPGNTNDPTVPTEEPDGAN